MNEALAKAMGRLDSKPRNNRSDSQLTLLPENRKEIEGFLKSSSTRNISENRLLKYASNLSTIGKLIGKPFRDCNREDIEQFLSKAQEKGYAKNTQRDFKVLTRLFFQWLYQCPRNEYPKPVSWIECGGDEWKDVKRDELIEAHEVARILDATPHARDKAAIAVLWSTGMRAGELLGLKVKDIYEDPETEVKAIRVEGTKTKYSKRDVGVADAFCWNLLQDWMHAHPQKGSAKEKETALWCNPDGSRISYKWFNQVLKESHRKAGIAKPANPHQYRHTWATLTANKEGLTRATFCYLGGWAPSSKVPDRYLHTDKRDAFRNMASTLESQKSLDAEFSELTIKLMARTLQKPEAYNALQKTLQETPELAEKWVALAKRLPGINLKEDAPTAIRGQGSDRNRVW